MLFATHVDTDDKTTTLIQGTGSNANNMQHLLVLTLTICNIFMIEVIDSEYTQESANETN